MYKASASIKRIQSMGKGVDCITGALKKSVIKLYEWDGNCHAWLGW